ncbi:hypothetical protein CR513_08655, partial [Mucuna pruriens]
MESQRCTSHDLDYSSVDLTIVLNLRPYQITLKIHIADENQLLITTTGDNSSSLSNIFVSPSLMSNLISIDQLVDNNCQDQHSMKIIAKEPKVGHLFPIHFLLYPNLSLPLVSCNFAIVDYQVCHKHLGHPNSNVLHDMLKSSFLGNKYTSSLNVVHFDFISFKLEKIVTLGFIFCTQKMKCFLLSNSFIFMFKPNSLPQSKFFALIMEGNTHHTHCRNFYNLMALYLKGHVHQPHNKME